MQGLIDRIKPKFQSNLHSFGEWLLYPQGWQVGTLDADNPIYVARSAAPTPNPAIPGFNPGQSADTLYVTNGETTDYADTSAGTIAYTPELGEGDPGAGFVFPDDEALVQAEFEKTLAFHLGLARSAARSRRTRSRRSGIDVEPFYLDPDDIDPQNGQTVAVRLQVRRVLRRPAGGAGARQAQPRRRHAALPGQRRRGPDRGRRASGTAASATAPATAPTTTSSRRR